MAFESVVYDARAFATATQCLRRFVLDVGTEVTIGAQMIFCLVLSSATIFECDGEVTIQSARALTSLRYWRTRRRFGRDASQNGKIRQSGNRDRASIRRTQIQVRGRFFG